MVDRLTNGSCPWRFRFFVATVLISTSVCVLRSPSQEPDPENASQPSLGGEANAASRSIKLAELPQPPPELATLIRTGEVELVSGGRPMSQPNTMPLNGQLAGETRFKFRYRYDSRARWTIQRNSGTRSKSDPIVRVNVRFRSIKLLATHQVWLRNVPQADNFWNDRVVQHEFDHVRISSDPRVAELFYGKAKKLQTMEVLLSKVKGRDGRVDNRRVQQLIENRMQEVLNTTTDLVRIRYRELDRLTRHGLKPIPEDADFSY